MTSQNYNLLQKAKNRFMPRFRGTHRVITPLGFGVFMNRFLVAFLCMSTLSACVSEPTAQQVAQFPQQVPADYRAQVVAVMKSYLVDPYSVRDAEITGPMAVAGSPPTPGVCARFNPKNNYGAYAGLKTFVISFKNGKALQPSEAVVTKCDTGGWRPFPEMMQG